MAGQLPQSRLLPAQRREVARRPAVLEQGREVHLRHGARGRRRAGQAAHQPAQGLVRQHREDRDARRAHGRLPPQAPSTVDPHDAGLGLQSRVRRPRPAGELPDELRGDGAVQAQGVAQGRVRRVRPEPRLLHQGPAVPRRAEVRRHRRARHALGRAAVRRRRRVLSRRDLQDAGRAAQEGGAAARGDAGQRERQQQRHHEHQEAALRQPQDPAGRQPRHRPPRAHPGRLPGRRRGRGRHGPQAPRVLGARREGSRGAARLRQRGRGEGQGQEDDGRGRLLT